MTAPVDTFRGRFLPYCIQPLGDGRYIVLNRDYKPLGFSGELVDYNTHPSTAEIKGLTAAQLAKIDYRGAPGTDGRIYLYNDGCIPTSSDEHWRAYTARLQTLAGLKLA